MLVEKTCSWISTKPGVTYRDETSIVSRASEDGIFSATSAMRRPAIATSRTAETLFLASTTRPPLRRRSYFVCAEMLAAAIDPNRGSTLAHFRTVRRFRRSFIGVAKCPLLDLSHSDGWIVRG